MSSHRRLLFLGKHHSFNLQRDWKRYGADSFEFKIVEVCLSREDTLQKEQYYLDLNNAGNYKLSYNISKSAYGNPGLKTTEETLKRMSEQRTGKKRSQETRNRMKQYWKDNPRPPISKETREKMSAAKKGIKQTKEHRAKIALTTKGRTRRSFSEERKQKISIALKGRKCIFSAEHIQKLKDSSNLAKIEYWVTPPNQETFKINKLSEFCKENNLRVACMVNVATGLVATHKGWLCSYVDINKFKPAKILVIKEYYFISPEGRVYTTTNLTEFAKEHNLDSTCLSRLASGCYKTHKKWKLG